MESFTNSENPDEMSHIEAIHQGLLCFEKVKLFFRNKSTIQFLKLKPDTPRYVQCTIPNLLYQTRRRNPLVYKGLTHLS